MPDLDTDSNAAAIKIIEHENEGRERGFDLERIHREDLLQAAGDTAKTKPPLD